MKFYINTPQDMATGVDNAGYKTKKNAIGEKLVECVKDPAIPVELKLRLIMIYIISQVDLLNMINYLNILLNICLLTLV